MHTLSALLILLSFVPICSASSAPPVKPLSGELVLRLNPASTSSCTTTTDERLDGQVSARSVTKSATRISEKTLGNPVLTLLTDDPVADSVRMQAQINVGRTKVNKILSLEIRKPNQKNWVDVDSLEGKDAEEPQRMKTSIGKLMENFSEASQLGRPLKSGMPSGMDIGDVCSALTGASKGKSSGGFTVLGIGLIKGREALISEGALALQCNLSHSSVSIEVQGWQAIDIGSGLQSGGYLKSKVDLESGQSFTKELQMDCLVSSDSSPATPSSDSTDARRRLSELKDLFERGLITNDQYEYKRNEIVKSL